MNTNNNAADASVLATLRALLPQRPLTLLEALRVAELQANRLLALRGMADDAPVPDTIVTELPRIRVDYDTDMPCSGASDWDTRTRCWVITLNALEPETRQRFSLLHEYKHIIDHGSAGLINIGDRTVYGHSPSEYLAEYFAGCVLMPKRLVRRAWAEGIQRVTDLAELFDVSPRAMTVRLAQLNLTDTASYRRCDNRRSLVDRRLRPPYHRAFSSHRPVELEVIV